MSRPTARPWLDKRAFYSQPEVGDSYERQRFGGASGSRVNAREIGLALDLLPVDGRILDLACGTGRLSRAIADRGQQVIAVDYSTVMAERAAESGIRVAIADAFTTPFRDAAFDGIASLRFAFHYPDLGLLLSEMARLARPGGSLVFDTYSWSPRSLIALGRGRWGGRVHVHSTAEVARVSTQLGLRIARYRPCFLFSPYLYRLAPLPMERAFEGMEPRVPASWLCRVFWQLKVP